MSYHTYNTSGLIIGANPSGESSRYVYVFTKELGLVGAHAQNTRHISSKLRYSLDAPAKATVSLVRGKNSWRLTSAVPEKRFYSVFASQPEKLKLCARTFFLIKKLLAGEEPNPQLFSTVESFMDFIEENDLSAENLKNIEAILVLRILAILGYLPDSELAREFAAGHGNGGQNGHEVQVSDWNLEKIAAMSNSRGGAIRIINESLRETGL